MLYGSQPASFAKHRAVFLVGSFLPDVTLRGILFPAPLPGKASHPGSTLSSFRGQISGTSHQGGHGPDPSSGRKAHMPFENTVCASSLKMSSLPYFLNDCSVDPSQLESALACDENRCPQQGASKLSGSYMQPVLGCGLQSTPGLGLFPRVAPARACCLFYKVELVPAPSLGG